jgi:hypothetical protein
LLNLLQRRTVDSVDIILKSLAPVFQILQEPGNISGI